jgi:hypothetical protein
MKINRVLSAILVACVLSGNLAAQSDKSSDLPHAGRWKINLSKSDFGETTVSYEQLSSGQMRFTTAGQAYDFRLDGKDYPSLFGGTAAWRQIDSSRWENAIKQNGKLINTMTVTVSADDRTLSTNEKGPKPTGGTFDRTTVYTRASGGPGLVGVWKTKNPPRMPRIVELVPSSANGLVIGFPDDKESCDAKFDGEDYPVTGPIAQPDMTLALTKTNSSSFDVTGKQRGKVIFKITFNISDDGRTLRQTGAIVGFSEHFVAVYDRQ